MSIIEILKQIFSATDEQATAFSTAMKENGIFTTTHENMDVRYPKMKTDFEGAVKERDTAMATVAQLEKAAKGQEDLQKIIADYKQTNEALTAQLNQEKLNSAIKVGLLSEKAVDVDYLTFKLNEKLKGDGETLTLDENGNIKGWKDKVDGLRTQFPNMFEAVSEGGKDGFDIVPLPLRKGNGGKDAPTKEAFRKYSYEERYKLKQENEALYKTLSE